MVDIDNIDTNFVIRWLISITLTQTYDQMVDIDNIDWHFIIMVDIR